MPGVQEVSPPSPVHTQVKTVAEAKLIPYLSSGFSPWEASVAAHTLAPEMGILGTQLGDVPAHPWAEPAAIR